MSLSELPPDLPVPQDDGAASHLTGTRLPDVSLPATSGAKIHLGNLEGLHVLYVYPMTGRPDVELPDGWDSIPGARGCTPQACAFRDQYTELQSLHAGVFGISTQQSDYQREAKDRLHLPFELLSDANLVLQDKLRLPVFTVSGQILYKRLTLIIRDGVIVKTFYPVFPPDRNAQEVVEWLQQHKP